MTSNPPRGVPRILPRLCYADVEAAARFLERAFGFREHTPARHEEQGRVTLTELVLADTRLMLGCDGAHDLRAPGALGGTTQLLVVYVDDLDGHCARARAAGARIVSEPEDMFWGDRRYECVDPEGHRWAFHEHLRDHPPVPTSA